MKTRQLEWWATLGPMAVAAVLVGYQLSQANVLDGYQAYDDGVYMGASLLAWRGTLPYADFTFVHPPGILLLMAPASLVSHFLGEADSFAMARLLTAAAAVANAGLAGAVVRRHGPLAMAIAGLAVATYPAAVASTHTLTLEPWVALLALAAAVVLFDQRGNVASGRRQVVAGVLAGGAILVKLTAVLMAAAVVIALVATSSMSAARRVTLAVVATVVVPLIVLTIPAGTAVATNIVGSQIGREDTGPWALSTTARLAALTGHWWPWGGNPPSWTVPVTVLAVMAVGAVWMTCRRQLRTVDLFVLAAATLGVVGLLVAPRVYPYYTYVPFVTVAMLLGATVGLGTRWASDALATPTTDPSRGPAPGANRRPAAIVTLAGIGVVTVVATVLFSTSAMDRTSGYLAGALPPPAAVIANVPPGSCVAADSYAPLIVANRFIDGHGDCDIEVDAFGLGLVFNDGAGSSNGVGFGDELAAQWRQRLAEADRVVMTVPYSSFLPWGAEQRAWFDQRFAVVGEEGDLVVYQARSQR